MIRGPPFFAVSAVDGTFAIEQLPAGTYTVGLWHERLSSATAQETGGDVESKAATFDNQDSHARSSISAAAKSRCSELG